VRGQRARIGDLVDGVLRRCNLERATREHRAVVLWPRLVGEDIARNSAATGVRDHVLLVSATTHAWAQTLDLMKPQVMGRLQERLGKDVVRDIHFSAGRRPPRRKPPGGAQPPQAKPLSDKERAEAEQAAALVQDPELREHAARAFASLIGARRRLEEQGFRACRECGAVYRGKGRRCSKCRAARRRGKRGRGRSESP